MALFSWGNVCFGLLLVSLAEGWVVCAAGRCCELRLGERTRVPEGGGGGVPSAEAGQPCLAFLWLANERKISFSHATSGVFHIVFQVGWSWKEQRKIKWTSQGSWPVPREKCS